MDGAFFTLYFYAYLNNDAQKFFLGKCLESFDTGIVKILRMLQARYRHLAGQEFYENFKDKNSARSMPDLSLGRYYLIPWSFLNNFQWIEFLDYEKFLNKQNPVSLRNHFDIYVSLISNFESPLHETAAICKERLELLFCAILLAVRKKNNVIKVIGPHQCLRI